MRPCTMSSVKKLQGGISPGNVKERENEKW